MQTIYQGARTIYALLTFGFSSDILVNLDIKDQQLAYRTDPDNVWWILLHLSLGQLSSRHHKERQAIPHRLQDHNLWYYGDLQATPSANELVTAVRRSL